MAVDESINPMPKKIIYGKEPPFPWRDVSIVVAIIAASLIYVFDMVPPIEGLLAASQPYIENLRWLWVYSFDKGGLIIAGIILGWLITRAFSSRPSQEKTSLGLPVWNSQSGGTAERRQLAFPPPYPNGWYRVGLSKDLPPMSVKPLRVLGRDLAIFRGQDGKVGVLAAFCTHLGAHLGIDSRVVGNCIECPFHGWTFDTSGKCTSIPYSDAKIPEQAHTEAYVVKEYHGHILLWYDAEKRQPEYDIPEVPEIVTGKYTYRSTCTLGLVSMHLQDLAENAADYAHFQQVHAVFYFPILSYFFYIRHNTTWEQDANEPHISYFHNTTKLVLKWGDRVVPFSTTQTLVSFHGPGALTLWRFRTFIGDVFMFKAFTPLETLKLRMEEVVYASKWFPNFMVKFMAAEAARALSDDFNIWSNKTYQRKPICVKGDGPIMKLRRWYAQFYSPNSKVAAQPGSEMEW